MKLKLLKHNQKGFTIVELMIASLVFSMILILLSNGIVQIGRMFYKSVIYNRTQETTRRVAEDISQSIQFSGGDVSSLPGNTGSSGGYCIGSKLYSYILNERLGSSTPSALLAENATACSGGTTPKNLNNPPDPEAVELLGENMQLLELEVREEPLDSNLWLVQVTVAHAADDMLDGAACKQDRSSSQFCAVSKLETTVVKRVK